MKKLAAFAIVAIASFIAGWFSAPETGWLVEIDRIPNGKRCEVKAQDGPWYIVNVEQEVPGHWRAIGIFDYGHQLPQRFARDGNNIVDLSEPQEKSNG